MTAKKRWFPKNFTDNDRLNGSKSDPDISWSNSDTEEDELNYLPKKPKLSEKSIKTTTKSSNWIKITPPRSKNNIVLDETSQECLITNKEQHRESPIINKIQTRQLSPILTQTYFRQTSPIISSREILQRIKLRHQSNGDDGDNHEIVENIDDNSSNSSVEIFQTQSEFDDNPLVISPVKTQLSQPLNDLDIDTVLTQDSSPVVIDSSSSTMESQLNQTSSPQPSVRKKQFKKDGLGYQLMRAINSQKTNYNIWQHEVYLNKNTQVLDNDKRIDFKINRQWLEYSLNVYECEETADISNRFLLIIGFNTRLNFPLEIDGKYSMFPPYNWKFVNSYQNCALKCYFNCVKFLKN